jgi:hypothetical protein
MDCADCVSAKGGSMRTATAGAVGGLHKLNRAGMLEILAPPGTALYKSPIYLNRVIFRIKILESASSLQK